MSNERDEKIRKAGWVFFFVVLAVGAIVMLVLKSGSSSNRNNWYRDMAKKQTEWYGAPTQKDVSQALLDLDRLKKEYDAITLTIVSERGGDDGVRYLDLVIAANKAASDYNRIANLRYYYWPSSGLPYGFPEKLDEDFK